MVVVLANYAYQPEYGTHANLESKKVQKRTLESQRTHVTYIQQKSSFMKEGEVLKIGGGLWLEGKERVF